MNLEHPVGSKNPFSDFLKITIDFDTPTPVHVTDLSVIVPRLESCQFLHGGPYIIDIQNRHMKLTCNIVFDIPNIIFLLAFHFW